MSEKIEAVTLFEREPGDEPQKSLRPGRHGDTTYLNDDNELKTETAEIVEFEEPVSPLALNDPCDYPPRVREFFGVDGDEDGDGDGEGGGR